MMGLMLLPVAIMATRPRLWWSRLYILVFLLMLVPTLLPGDVPFSLWGTKYGLPASGQYFTSVGVQAGGVDCTPEGILSDPRPPVMPGVVIRLLVLGGVIGLAGTVYVVIRRLRTIVSARMRWFGVAQLAPLTLLAASLCQLVAMVQWTAQGLYFDRYLISLLPGPMIFLASLSRRRPSRAIVCVALPIIGFFWASGFAFSYDYSRCTGARAALYGKLLSREIPPREIDGGFEFNAETQLELAGSIAIPC